MAKVQFRGFWFDERTVEMIKWAEQQAGFKFRITQGSYSDGVAASAGTHDGGGAVDFSIRLTTKSRRFKMLKALKDAGFAAWLRKKSDGFSVAHIHAIAIGCKDLAPLAKQQVKDFDNRLNGLKSRQPDLTYRPTPPVQWSSLLQGPTPRKVAAK